MGCAGCGRRHQYSRPRPATQYTLRRRDRQKLMANKEPESKAAAAVPDTRGPIDPSTGLSVELIKTGNSEITLGTLPTEDGMSEVSPLPQGGDVE